MPFNYLAFFYLLFHSFLLSEQGSISPTHWRKVQSHQGTNKIMPNSTIVYNKKLCQIFMAYVESMPCVKKINLL